jgi:hypothetical protein
VTIRLGIAIATAALCAVSTAAYMVAGIEPYPAMDWFLGAAPLIAVILWLCKDARERGIGAVHDLGFFMMLFWPFVIPWYAFASRGRGGWKLLAGLIALIGVTPLTITLLTWLLQA